MTTALIVVDVQNDFAHPDGNLYVRGGEHVAGAVNDLLDDYDVVVYTRDFHPPATDHFMPNGPWPEHCVGGTWGAEYFDELRTVGNLEILKGTSDDEDGYSGFHGERDGEQVDTGLDYILQSHDVDSVDIVGIALDVCVKSTALDAVGLDYSTRVIVDATAAVYPDKIEKTLSDLEAAGVEIV